MLIFSVSLPVVAKSGLAGMGTANSFRWLRVLGEKVLDVAGVLGELPGPRTEAVVFIDGFRPFIEEASLHLVLLQVLTFDLKDCSPSARVGQK